MCNEWGFLWVFQWMNNFWKSDKCYSDNGVDGTLCSFRYYLSEVSAAVLDSSCVVVVHVLLLFYILFSTYTMCANIIIIIDFKNLSISVGVRFM